MTPTDVRAALTAVSDAVPVPPPDRLAVQRRVTRARRRRTTLRVVAAVAAVAMVAGGSAVALRPHAAPLAPAHRTPVVSGAAVPVVVHGSLGLLAPGGRLTDTGVRIAHLVGTTPQGVVAFAADGDLVRVQADGDYDRLVDWPVRTAYLQGDQVIYQTFDGTVRRLGSGTSTIDPERLMAAGPAGHVLAGDDGLALIDPSGDGHPLWLGDHTKVVRGVDVGGERVAIRTDERLFVIDADGGRSGSILDDRVGQLAPDGSTYAHQTTDRDGVELLDPSSFVATPVHTWDAPVRDLRWSGTDLLVVVGHGTGEQTLWRCPGGTGCTQLLSEPDGGLRLD